MPDDTDHSEDNHSIVSRRTTRERWARVEQLFHEASELAPDQQHLLLDAQCSDDESLKQGVLRLLGSNSSVRQLMASPVVMEGQHLTREPDIDRWIGRVLGGFRIESLLGRGGMGVVYLGVRVDAVLSQQVAIKLMATSLQSTPAQTHFQLERDALATLEHPHIARLVGGGVTPDQLPFVVMEYIEGKRLDIACDDPAVSLQQIVNWMLQLCDAVSHVHRNLFLHRDLKPGNVMVTARGDVKLLDFGTFKAIAAGAAPDSAMTQAGMRPVTLRYASPEHIRGESGSTELDVYSLGMTLYCLLAGQLPSIVPSTIPGYLDQLQQERTPPPSAVMDQRRRMADAALAADLDAITLKAIRYRAADRYEGADALAADLRRALERKPVAARASTISYRVSRFTHRHRSWLSGAAAGVIVLGIGLPAMAHEAAIARIQSRRADVGIEQERKLAHLLLSDYFDRLKRVPGSTDAQRRAVSQALRYLDNVNQGPLNPDPQLDIIHAYTEMGLLQGSQYEENLGDTAGGIATLTKAVNSARGLVHRNSSDTTCLESYATAEQALGQVYFTAGNTRKAVEHLTAAAEVSRQLSTMPGVTSKSLVQAASTVDALGDTLGLPGVGTANDPVKAIERYKQASDVYRRALLRDPACFSCARGIAIEDYKLGLDVEDESQAAAFDQDGLSVLAIMPPAEQTSTRNLRADNLLRQNLGALDIDLGQTTQGLAMMQTVRQRMRAAVQADPLDTRARNDLALFDGKLATSFDDLGQYPQERDALKEFVATMDALLHKNPDNAIWKFRRALALSRYGAVQLRLGQELDGQRAAKESLSILLPLAQKPEAQARVLAVATEALIALHPNGRLDGQTAVSLAERTIAGEQRPDARDYIALAQAQQLAGRQDDSRASAQTALRLLSLRGQSLSDSNARTRINALIHPSEATMASR
jgi:serine/threonine protein kinase